jgi:hypothetical protein
MKYAHAGGPRATSMESEADHQNRKQRNQTALKSQITALLDSHPQLRTVHPPCAVESLFDSQKHKKLAGSAIAAWTYQN